ncbi:hypothetical protein ACFQ1M_07170 [Sungkyunkwania multivorans]|uniref:Uncharacterized protein n=1 Tax=Sungkyunkwania multivorans TaxID=1173618 RepID=A0ABW3CY43_9FLAO
MNFFDQLFYKVLRYYQERARKGHFKKAISKAVLYISFLQISTLLLVGLILVKLIGRSYAFSMTETNGWTLFILSSIGIYFYNTLHYNGRKRMKIKSEMIGGHKKTTQIWIYWVVPFAMQALIIIFLQAF